MLSDERLPRYRLLENFTIKWNGNGNGNAHGNGNAYDRGDYNSSFALRAVELKSRVSHDATHMSLFMRKPAFAYAKTKTQISFAVTAKLISAFVFATQIVQSLYFLNTNF